MEQYAEIMLLNVKTDPRAVIEIKDALNVWDHSPAALRVFQAKIDRSSPDSFSSHDILEAAAAHEAMANRDDLQFGGFNTGRKYTKQGQKITWKCIDIEIYHDEDDGESTFFDVTYFTVEFEDHSRGIKGRITIIGNDPSDKITQDAIMKAYDKGDYQNVS